MPADRDPADATRDLALVELVNRVLDRGAVITGHVLISVAGIDLIHVGLQLIVAAVESEDEVRGVARRITDDRIRRALRG
jgi:hypothetical protein